MISLPILLASLGCAMALKLTPVHEWTHIEYHWNSESAKERAIATGLYNSTKVFMYDAEWYKDGRWFVTTPRIHDANPASLSTVFEQPGDKGAALLQPYPSPEWHVVGKCSGITNAVKIIIDKCDNMWIVDSGVIGNEMTCPAQILKIDLKTDQLVMRYEIPEEVRKGGLLVTAAIRTEGPKCDKILLIAADVRGSGYMIFDGSTSWRLGSDIFEPDADFTSLTVDDRTVNITYGPFGFLDIGEKFADTELGIMWSFSGKRSYGLSIHDLINSRHSQANLQWYQSVIEFPSPATAALVSRQGIFFTSFVGRQKLSCGWLGNPMRPENMEVLIQESELPLTITGIKTTTRDDGNEYLWFTMNNYIRLRAGIKNFCQVNAGIYVANIADLTNGTRCQPKAHVVPCKSWAAKGYTPLKNRNDFNL